MAETAALTAPVLPRRRELLFGTAFATAGVLMVMVTLIGAYLAVRGASGTAFLPENKIPLTQPNMMLLTIVMSVFTMQWAVYAISRDDRKHTYLALGVTLLLGFAFANQQTFLWKQASVVLEKTGGALFYCVTGGSFAMVVVGMIFIALMAFRALGGQFDSRQPDGISAAAIFWYAAAAVYAVVWIAVYIMK